MSSAEPTIAVFDSGVGGLSVLKALRADMPQGRFVYLADSGYAPYGERGDAWVEQRCHEITDWLLRHHTLDALVVACNTATAAAIDRLRALHPTLPMVGVEPGLKPAGALTRTGHVGVMATRGTVRSQRFASLMHKVNAELSRPVHWHVRACDGLADAIERHDTARVTQLCVEHTHALMEQAASQGGVIDVVALGCTHYPFAANEIQAALGPQVALIDTGPAVARHTRHRLGGLASEPPPSTPPTVTLLTTGAAADLDRAAHRWLGTQHHSARAIDLPNRA